MKAVIALVLMLLPALMGTPRAALAAPAVVHDTFADPLMEQRARNLQRQLRCLVCQGESVDDSSSPFSADIRTLVRAQIAEGKTDQQIEDFLVARYGDFILMKPPLQADTWLLWLAPFGVLAVAGTVAWLTIKKASAPKG